MQVAALRERLAHVEKELAKDRRDHVALRERFEGVQHQLRLLQHVVDTLGEEARAACCFGHEWRNLPPPLNIEEKAVALADKPFNVLVMICGQPPVLCPGGGLAAASAAGRPCLPARLGPCAPAAASPPCGSAV